MMIFIFNFCYFLLLVRWLIWLRHCASAVKGLKLPPEEQKAKADNVWNHLRTCPSFTEAMMARLNTGTNVLTAGGEEKVFQQTFERMTGEELLHSYACYLSTSHGPVIGMLYSSDKRIVFCSDFSYYLCPGNPTLMHYKVVVPLDQLRTVNPSANRWNPSEKYIRIVTTYDKALRNLNLRNGYDARILLFGPRIPYLILDWIRYLPDTLEYYSFNTYPG